MSSDVDCSIVVPLFNKVELTRRCVRSVRANTEPGTYELILVDNGSSDDTASFCDTLRDDEDVVVIVNEVNQGFAKACNQGARAATRDHIVFLNNDTEVHPNWLPPLLSHLDDPTVGAVGSKLLFPNGTLQHAGVVLVHNASKPGQFTPVHWLYGAAGDAPEANITRPYQVVTAASVLVRRSTFFDLGAFDEGFWNGYEDVDLCLRIGAAGHKIIYEPASVVTHVESASGAERFRKVDQNVVLLMEKWAGKVTIDLHVGLNGHATFDPDGALADQQASEGDDGHRTNVVSIEAGDSTASAPDGVPDEIHERERTREKLERVAFERTLDRLRSGRDVCWLEDDGDTEPLVTVRIATYDRGPLVVERAVASALAQTYEHIEVLVVGDACDDATTDALNSVDDPRLRFVRLPTRGVYPDERMHRWMVAGAHPMVTALDLARGAWLAPCDDDDELTADHVEVLMREAKERRLEMVWSRARCETSPGRWRELGSDRFECGHISHGSVMYSLGLRRLIPNSGAWRIGEPGDWNLWRRMHNAGVRTGFVDHMTYIHYVETHKRHNDTERPHDRDEVHA